MGEEIKPAVSRRGLLRRASTVAAGVGVVAAASAAPALAADGDAIQVGGTYTGGAKTSLTSGNSNTPVLKLANASTAGVPLELAPVTLLPDDSSPVIPGNVPTGSTYVDNWGDVHVIGKQSGVGANLDLMSYSATWSTQPFPVAAFRLVDTRGKNDGVYNSLYGFGTTFVSGANFSSPAGGIDNNRKMLPKNGSSLTPDMTISLSDFLLPGGFAAIQANLAVAAATADGWAAVYSGEFLGTASINYGKAQFAIANFVQTVLNNDLTFYMKTQLPIIVILDLVGFIVSDPINQGLGVAGSGVAASMGSAKARAAAPKGSKVIGRR